MSTEIRNIKEALNYIDSTNPDILNRIGSALKTELGEDGFLYWKEWLQSTDNYHEEDDIFRWKSFTPGAFTIRTLYHFAEKGGFTLPDNPTFKQENDTPPHNTTSTKSAIQNLAKKGVEEQKIKVEQARVDAIENSKLIWQNATPVKNHPYLINKQINSSVILQHLKQTRIKGANLLLVPLINIKGEIQSLQYITEDGTKRFTNKEAINGNFFLLDDENKAYKEVILVEDLAAAASIYEATNKPVLITFNTENMITVAELLSKHNFSEKYTLAFNNDASETILYNSLLAQQFLPDAKIMIPDFSENEIELYQDKYLHVPADFNDKHLISGLNSIRKQFKIPLQENTEQNKKNDIRYNQDHSLLYSDIEEYQQMLSNNMNFSQHITPSNEEIDYEIEESEKNHESTNAPELSLKRSKSHGYTGEFTLNINPPKTKRQ